MAIYIRCQLAISKGLEPLGFGDGNHTAGSTGAMA